MTAHHTTGAFWTAYNALPPEVRKLADKQFQLLKQNERHPSIQLKQVGENTWSARVSQGYRALAAKSKKDGAFAWFWIGNHNEYERLIK